jgi:protein PhnA
MSSPLTDELAARAAGACELCGGSEALARVEVSGAPTGTPADLAACRVCTDQLADGAELDQKHWFCLQESIWSGVAAVQVLSYRLARRLQHEGWASDLLDQVWLDEDNTAWANAIGADVDDDDLANVVVDCNGVVLANGDAVTLTKGLDVKGANFTAKRGTVVRKIRLTDVPEHILGRVNGVEIYIKGCFLKKVN